jgi:peptidoglycan/LPS O-acetylase OafA/YrhL
VATTPGVTAAPAAPEPPTGPSGLFSFAGAAGAPAARVHHPALDGLRGVAVTAVVVYHHNPARLPGGFLGVDVFFVLSGFLITGLLVDEALRDGTVGLRRFWAARVRRLAPALGLTLLLVCAYASWLAPAESLHRLRGDALAGLAQVANWRFVAEGQSYFFEFAPSPLRHLWSLSVEEQWYLAWPLVVAVLAGRSAGRPARALRRVLVGSVVLALASTLAMAWVTRDGTGLSRAYYGTDTHAAGLLVGAALAVAGRLAADHRAAGGYGAVVRRHAGGVVVGATGLAGAALVAWAMFEVGGTDRWLYRGGFLVLALASACVVVACVRDDLPAWENPLGRVLALWPLRALGRISYGVYLFHWPLFFVLTPERTGLVGRELLAVRSLATLALATASFVLIEQPVRRGVLRGRTGAWAAAVGVATLLAVVLTSTVAGRPSLLQRPDLDVASRPVPAVPVTRPGEPPDAVPSRVLVVGDSVAFTLATGFEHEAVQDDLLVWNQAVLYCELLDLPRREAGEVRPASDSCGDWPERWADAVDEFDPDVAVLHVGPWEVFDRVEDGATLAWGEPELDRLLRDALTEAVEVLGARGATVVLLASPPLDRTDGVSNPEWTLVERGRVAHLGSLLAEVAAAQHSVPVEVLDMGQLVCPVPATGCPTDHDGVELRGDGVHYTAEGAEAAAAWLAPDLRRLALEAPDPDPGATAP